MIYSRHNFFVLKLFDWYFKRIFNRHFRKIECEHDFRISGENSVLIFCNHISWWDGIWMYLLNKKVFKKRLHVMMLEHQLRKNRILSFGGAFSIKKGSKDLINSLKYAHNLLNDPGNMVLIFPQGKIESQLKEELSFEKGVKKIINEKADTFFAASFVDYGSSVKPTLKYYFKKVSPENLKNPEEHFNRFYSEVKEKQIRYVERSLV